MKTITQAVLEAVLTEPAGRIVTSEIRKQVEAILGIESKTSAIPNCLSKWMRAGILKRVDYGQYEFEPGGQEKMEKLKATADKRKYKKRPRGRAPAKKARAQPGPPAEVDSLMIGNAIIAKFDSLRDEIRQLKNRLTDAAVRHDADLKAWRQKLKAKDNTIRELQGDLERYKKANEVKKRTVPFNEIAVIR
jgi:hypothetical protein